MRVACATTSRACNLDSALKTISKGVCYFFAFCLFVNAIINAFLFCISWSASRFKENYWLLSILQITGRYP